MRHYLSADVVRAAATQLGDRTDYAIARRLGLRQSTVSRLMAGRTVPTVTTLVAVRDAYGITLDDLVVTAKAEAAEAVAA